MTDQDDFDARLAAHFEQEHRHVPVDAFVAATMRKVREGRRRRDMTRVGLRAAALGAAVLASPWLIAGAEHVNAAFDSSLSWAMGGMGTWVMGAAAVGVVLAMRLRRR